MSRGIREKNRPTKRYTKNMCDAIIHYFDVPAQIHTTKKTYYADGALKSEDPVILPTRFPTIEGFAAKMGVSVEKLKEWANEHKEFAAAMERAENMQKNIWLINSMSGDYNSSFAQFYGKSCLNYENENSADTEFIITVVDV